MPTYDYYCTKCQHQFEEIQKITDAKLKECPKCHQFSLERAIGGGIGLAFKGSGFYITDYGPLKNSNNEDTMTSNQNNPSQTKTNSNNEAPSKESTTPLPSAPKKTSCGCGKPKGSCHS